jgi:hypothetical protein
MDRARSVIAMSTFEREGNAARLTAAPELAARLRDFMHRGVPILRGPALWRIVGAVEGGAGRTHFGLALHIDLKPARDQFAHAGLG